MPQAIHNLRKRYILYGIALLVFSVLLVNISSAFADTTVTYEVQVEPSLNISFSSDNVSLDLNPLNKTFDTQDLLVTVSTNNSNGYKLYVNTDNDTTNLINTNYSDAYIETLGSTVTESTFDTNKWGFRITGDPEDSSITGDTSITSTTSFFPFAPGSLISSSSTATNASSATLTFASKINYQKPSGTYTLDLNFKALPLITTLTMQEIGSASDTDKATLCTADPTLVVDSRDGQTYAIARLADGKCWMVQNLKLGKLSDSIALTSADSNVSSGGFTLDGELTDGVFHFYTIDGIRYQNDSSEYYCTEAYGCYYNAYTATAGAMTSATGENVTVIYSICPVGWSLPTGGSGGEFEALANAYGGTDVTAAANLLVADPTSTIENINGQYVPGILLSGRYNNSGAEVIGEWGYGWSRTSKNQQGGHGFIISASQVYPLDALNKAYGLPVRCLLQES
ncbi:hypothetical protein IJI79_01275 [Candidatus Saccharibacteria bacterium]|nr:hypothetical protein [Candidatus Saccharibacteria bacterium]